MKSTAAPAVDLARRGARRCRSAQRQRFGRARRCALRPGLRHRRPGLPSLRLEQHDRDGRAARNPARPAGDRSRPARWRERRGCSEMERRAAINREALARAEEIIAIVHDSATRRAFSPGDATAVMAALHPSAGPGRSAASTPKPGRTGRNDHAAAEPRTGPARICGSLTIKPSCSTAPSMPGAPTPTACPPPARRLRAVVARTCRA